MRKWIEHLITNASAHADFIEWAKDSESELNIRLARTVRDNNLDEARGIAHEIRVYETMRKKIEAEARERTAQANYENERRQQ